MFHFKLILICIFFERPRISENDTLTASEIKGAPKNVPRVLEGPWAALWTLLLWSILFGCL